MGCVAQNAFYSVSVQGSDRGVAVLTGTWELKPADLNDGRYLLGKDAFGA